ncbi:hypothetical protein TRFO_15424 [Tritrichomonas foetus]|uniref:Uncharacterized protein n=1 Tax=Tritrichomonas foetus TaxID=1144522 RepID=A0A1J4KSK1_9EUKA|nr:hypothetical protein TRFO_15424 [Tritrichomonas foetus]|eukprot:OHT14263.1 hypothetical protein TRFO_15424 [Tritrichomonas foetus]
MTDFSSLFPLNVASKELLSARALNGLLGHCSCYSAIWRHFLIIFPKHGKPLLKSQVWMDTLASSREIYTQKFKKEQYAVSLMKARKDYQSSILTILGKAFLHTTGSFKSSELDKILRILYFFLDDDSDLDYMNSIIFLITRLYYQFDLESVQNRDKSPYSTLMDANFICHDICLCAQNLKDQLLSPFFKKGRTESMLKDFHKNHICFLIGQLDSASTERPPVEQILPIMNLYSTLFVTITQRKDINSVWSIIFSRFPDPTILHYFYAFAFLHTKQAVPEKVVPMSTFGVEIGKLLRPFDDNTEKNELLKASQRIDELIKLLQEDDGIKNREIVRNQATTIIQIARGTAHIEDLIPIPFISEFLSQFIK